MGGLNIANLRHVDDTAPLATPINDMRKVLTKLKKESSKEGLLLNIKKTKIMHMGEKDRLTKDGEDREEVEKGFS